jgi:hypothetical protein
MDQGKLEHRILTHHLRMTAASRPAEAQWLAADLLRNLLAQEGYLAQMGFGPDGATIVCVTGSGKRALIIVPARSWRTRGYNAEHPAPWVAGLIDSRSGRLLGVPEDFDGRQHRRRWWLARPVGADLAAGLAFAHDAITRTRAHRYEPVICPPNETVVV